ncbi:transglycosylase domain-containing protein [Paucibacter sp. XJ19-41]|uniref:transglycosylase domain-containing protein n=1 Tax=Paucibacter sp. XJ19-41 TaxID=2927824 RepID=UPI00234A323C|nr:transglycosylase domain-containing protein [Paucibacter sp. XJ19-41]MDC6170977.1 transglycosylase domain-containing protein [Paucibacter sp. XJ19-41]
MARAVGLIWLGGGLAATAALAGFTELRSSRLQATLWSSAAREASYRVEAGPSPSISFPGDGPYDERMGYSALPQHIERLQQQGFVVASQARQSPQLLAMAGQGLFIPYREKSQAGLLLRDCRGEALLALRQPQRQYARFEDIPPLLVQTLLFIEDRHLLDEDAPRRNPALDPERFGKAALQQLQQRIDASRPASGGSTLATQIEKYRHSPQGRTGSVGEKLRQMASASQRAYLDGEQTLGRRREILRDYLNTVPLAARPGIGEVHGLGDGLWAWYGRDADSVNRLLLQQTDASPAQALAYKQALSLLIAQRRPSQFLRGDGQALRRLTDSYLRLLAEAGAIPLGLRDAALPLALTRAEPGPQPQRPDFVQRKASGALRVKLAALLDMPRSYELDRLDLAVQTSLDGRAQALATRTLAGLQKPEAARAAGLYGPHLLEAGADLRPLVFSLTIYERGAHSNRLRVQADSLAQPFDVNLGAKLDLGSTAKLRTLISYLEVIAELHQRWAGLTPEALRALAPSGRDALSLWARDYLLQTQPPRELPAMLDAALQRRYSAHPGEAFFTGGGLHRFENFAPEHQHQQFSVSEAFKHSVNLVFIRLMRDIIQHRIHGGDAAALMAEPGHPRRQALLQRFAAAEGGHYLAGFLRQYQGLSAAQARERLLADTRPTLPARAALLYLLEPAADEARLRAWLAEQLPQAKVDAATHRRYQALSLADRAYLAGRHPLELWLVGQLQQTPDAGPEELLAASAEARQQAYAWLFKTRQRAAQDQRLRQMLEREAFGGLLQSWRRLGYPFDRLTPSYASAIGASGDRPAALAELMGIIVNQGARRPQQPIEALHFAAGTPFDTRLEARGAAVQQVLAPAVAEAAWRALVAVVEDGTARRLRGVFLDAQGQVLPVGGKTGTGDHRQTRVDKNGRLISERVVERSGTLVFTLGERYFGTVTSYVHEPDAARYHFTSALSVQLLKSLGPSLLASLQKERCSVD